MALRSPGPVPPRSAVPGQGLRVQTSELEQQDVAMLDEMVKRLACIGHSYSTLAQQLGALYMRADESGLDSLTQVMDGPMRNASSDQQTLDALRVVAQQARQDQGG